MNCGPSLRILFAIRTAWKYRQDWSRVLLNPEAGSWHFAVAGPADSWHGLHGWALGMVFQPCHVLSGDHYLLIISASDINSIKHLKVRWFFCWKSWWRCWPLEPFATTPFGRTKGQRPNPDWHRTALERCHHHSMQGDGRKAYLRSFENVLASKLIQTDPNRCLNEIMIVVLVGLDLWLFWLMLDGVV